LPPAGATLVLGSWEWDLFPEREKALRQWVESGGHLVVPLWRKPAWVQVSQHGPQPAIPSSAPLAPATAASAARVAPLPGPSSCHDASEPDSVAPAYGTPRRYRLCNNAHQGFLRSDAPVRWQVDGPRGAELIDIGIGRGSATVHFGTLIDNANVFEGDNALVFIGDLRLQRGDEVWFVDGESRTPLLALIWHTGAPAVLLGALALALLLWRAGVRFGPRAAIPPLARRSVAEQIRGTASFIFQRNSAALHRAQLRALEEQARRTIRDHARLDRRARAEAIARATALDANDLARAMDPALKRPRRDLLATLALLETAVRRLRLNQ
jgi:hypothetical protein